MRKSLQVYYINVTNHGFLLINRCLKFISFFPKRKKIKVQFSPIILEGVLILLFVR